MTQQQKLLGLAPEPRTLVDNRVWFGQKLALWKSKVDWEIVGKQAADILARCSHMAGCAGAADEHEPCLADCPDREFRLSASVILNAARQHAAINASKIANQPYTMPSREYFSAVVSDLAACQAELETLRAVAAAPPTPADPPQLPEKQT